MVQSLMRAMEILEHLRQSDKSCSLAELTRKTGLPSSTVHRILQTFCSTNYVVRDPKTHLYRLGTALIPLGMAATRRLKLRDSALPVLKNLMRMTEEDVFLIIISGYQGIVLEKVEGPNPLKVVERFGGEVDLHCGGIRRSLFAYQPDSFIESYIRHHLPHMAEHPEERETLLRNLSRIREEGVAVSRGEYIPHAVGIGAPVFDMNDKAIASIGLIAPQSRTPPEQVKRFKELVKQHAEQLSALLGYVRNNRGISEECK